MRTAPLIVSFLAVAPVCTAQTVQDFETEGAPYEPATFGAEPGPVVEDGVLTLVNPVRVRAEQRNTIAFAREHKGCFREIEARFTFTLGYGAHGMGFALLSTDEFGAEGPARDCEWEAPNLPGTFAVGLDTFDPPSSTWFDGYGNFYDRPQREVSLHWDGRELAKRVSPVEFRGLDDEHRFRLLLRFIAGGAEVSLWIDDQPLWEDAFFAGISAYECRAAFGARTGETKTTASIDDIRIEQRDPGDCASISPEPVIVHAFEHELLYGARRNADEVVSLPLDPEDAARVIAVLTLEPGPGGWDKWDRSAAVYAWRSEGDKAERFEVLRYITPYRREWTWRVDVTDFEPLLRGDVKLGLLIDSWEGKVEEPAQQKGFDVSLDLEYYLGAPRRRVLGVVNLWNQTYHFGNTQDEIDAAFQPIRVKVPEGTTSARVRVTTTGHGGFGEFTPNERTLTIDGQEFRNTLWKEDVYLNPVRPQSGTWKFDRAGWAPGDVVLPWTVEVPSEALSDGEVEVLYRPSVFEGEAGDANHWVASQIVFYADE